MTVLATNFASFLGKRGNKRNATLVWTLMGAVLFLNCGRSAPETSNLKPIPPRAATQPVRFDSDDPAIWVNPADPSWSPILGTDKDTDGALYAFGLDGGAFPPGLFVSMSDDKTFHLYSWADIAGSDLIIAPGGRKSKS